MWKITINPKYDELNEWIHEMPSNFDTTGRIIYQGRNIIRLFEVGAHQLVVKRYCHPNLFQGIGYAIYRPSKAKRAFNYAACFRDAGLKTPTEIAYLEHWDNGFLQDSYFVSEYCSYSPLSEILVDVPEFNRLAADAFANYIVSMHLHGVFHGDMNLSNFLYCWLPNGQLDIVVIDLNRSVFCRETPKRCMRNFQRITHRPSLFFYIVEQYLKIRQWEEIDNMYLALGYYKNFTRRWKIKKVMKERNRRGLS